MEELKTIEILKTAILIERRGEAFYRKVSEQANNSGVKKIFDIMAKEEVLHAKILRDKYAEFVRDKTFSPAKLPETDDESAAEIILTDEVKQQISGAGFEAAAISAAIDMENKAIEVYSDRAKHATDPNEKKLYKWLADWERGHHKLLFDLDRDLRERVWNDNQFWPF